MKKGLIAFIGCVMLAQVCRAGFVPGTEDIPAMDEMTFSDDVVSFDAPEGQILTVSATAPVSAQRIRSFYLSSLKALGWSVKGKDKFVRGSDTLELEIISDAEACTVRFNLTFAN